MSLIFEKEEEQYLKSVSLLPEWLCCAMEQCVVRQTLCLVKQ